MLFQGNPSFVWQKDDHFCLFALNDCLKHLYIPLLLNNSGQALSFRAIIFILFFSFFGLLLFLDPNWEFSGPLFALPSILQESRKCL